MNAVKKVLSYHMLIMLGLGYAAGMPLLLIGSTLQAWMKDSQVDLTTIGFFSLVGLPWTLKFLWSPFLDRYQLPFLGRRRGWILVFQLLLITSILALSMVNPETDLKLVAIVAFLISFFSASQDIVLDAYRREILPDEELGLGSSVYITGYRIGMLVSGAAALTMADNMPWKMVYFWLAVLMGISILFTLFSPKENTGARAPKTLQEAVVGPLVEFFTRPGAILILVFILLYKAGDTMAANMTTPFILDIGYSKTEIGKVAKIFGMLATILGGVIGGTLMLKMDIKKSLVVFGIFQAVSTLGFSVLPSMPFGFYSLASIIALENLASGMGTAAYAAYMASLTNRQFTATQYSLLSALMGVPRVILASPTGWMAEQLGWVMFFVVCTFIAVPGLLMLIPVFRLEPKKS